MRSKLVVADDDIPYTFDPLTKKRRRRNPLKKEGASLEQDQVARGKKIASLMYVIGYIPIIVS